MYTANIYSQLDVAPPQFSIQDSEVTPDVQDPHDTTFDSMLESLAAMNSSAQSLPSDTMVLGPDGLPIPPDKPGWMNIYGPTLMRGARDAAKFGINQLTKGSTRGYGMPIGYGKEPADGLCAPAKKRKAQHVKKPKALLSPMNAIEAANYKNFKPRAPPKAKAAPKKRMPAKK